MLRTMVEKLLVLVALITLVRDAKAGSKLLPKGTPLRSNGNRYGQLDSSSFDIAEDIDKLDLKLMPDLPEVAVRRSNSQRRRHSKSRIFIGGGNDWNGFPFDVSIVETEASVQGFVLFKDTHYIITGSLEDGRLSVQEKLAIDYLDESEVVDSDPDRRQLQPEVTPDPQQSFLRRVVAQSEARELQTAKFSVMVR